MDKRSIALTSPECDKVSQFLEQLDLTADQAQVFTYLHALGPTSVLSLSKALATGRTRLYPILESLAGRQLIIIHERHYGTTYEAASPQALEFLVHEREIKVGHLRDELFDVQNALLQLSGQVTKGSRVAEYRGVDGLKQINFNLTKAVDEFCVFEVARLDEHEGMTESFSNRLRETWLEKKIVSRDLTNNPKWQRHSPAQPAYVKVQRGCYVEPSVFEISLETFVYNNCVAYLHYEEGQIFGVEVYNEKLANQQKQLFEIVWSQGTEL
ncbi:MAG TPA: helix-turn-helix domain-containing protein [Acidimicrobiia bacterium]|nr:helix-turn-helix domain-containing protein [Acidimicrobiia bacterium]